MATARLTKHQLAPFETVGYLGFPGLLADRAAAIIESLEVVGAKYGGGRNGKPHDENAGSVILQFLDQSEYLWAQLEQALAYDEPIAEVSHQRRAEMAQPARGGATMRANPYPRGLAVAQRVVR